MKAFLKRDKKKGTATVIVEAAIRSDITDVMEVKLYREMMDTVAKKFAEEYYTDIIKRIDPKVITALVAVEAAKKAMRE